MTQRYEPTYKPGELRNMKKRSNRTDYPDYHMIPPDSAMINILEKLSILNGAIKFEDCPIRKTPFYNLKGRTIIYFLTICKAGLRPWSYKFNGLQESPKVQIHNRPQVLAAIELSLVGMTFKFHIPVSDPLMNVLFDEIYLAELHPFKSDEHTNIDMLSTMILWEELLKTYEDNNWFIYEQSLIHQWLDYMKTWYPHLKIRPACGISPKLSIMLNGGPMIQIRGSDVCKFDEFRYNFSKILKDRGFYHDFTLVLKK